MGANSRPPVVLWYQAMREIWGLNSARKPDPFRRARIATTKRCAPACVGPLVSLCLEMGAFQVAHIFPVVLYGENDYNIGGLVDAFQLPTICR